MSVSISPLGSHSFVRAAAPGSLADDLARGNARATISFGGNGTPWLSELRSVLVDCPAGWPIVEAAAARLQVFGDSKRVRWSGLCGHGFDLLGWLRGTSDVPPARSLQSGAVSQPAIFLTQVVRYIQILESGLAAAFDVTDERCVIDTAIGYSQGLMTALWVSETHHRGAIDAQRVADFAVYLAWQGWCAADRTGVTDADGPCMAAVVGPTIASLSGLVDEEAEPLVIAMINGRTRHVISGTPAAVDRLHAKLLARQSAEKQARKGGSAFTFAFHPLTVECPFHSAFNAPGLELMREVMAEEGFTINPAELALCVLDSAVGMPLAEALVAEGHAVTAATLLDKVMRLQFVDPVRWANVIDGAVARGTDAVLDFGVGPGVARLTTNRLAGLGVPVLSLSEPSGRAALLTPKGVTYPPKYSDYAPGRVQLADGTIRLDNAYSRATGHAPVILPGMTPTTADAPIVAAAANAGFTAELAGGGQVTADIFHKRMAELAGRLTPGATFTFNALFMDRYLWDLHLSGAKLVQKARKSGIPIAGVTVSAGIPSADEGAMLLGEWAALGMHLNVFKPGTVRQVDQVLAIADAAPAHTVFMHLEGGKAGGHHSWEDLEGLLLRCYDKVRQRANVILCVGGGIADAERATALVVGHWAKKYGLRDMPIDGVLLGTVTMACKEAATSPQVKAALVAAAGTTDWVPSGAVVGGMTSGLSQLGADIHYLDNAAARCGRLLDSVAGDAEAIAAQRPAIIAALDATAKPYFGDFARMSWSSVLNRLVELMAIGRSGPYEDGIWPDVSYRQRVADVIALAEGRLHHSAAEVASLVGDIAALDDPTAVIAELLERYPHASSQLPHPVDEDTFVKKICARPGKPVNFVPTIDADVRRWYKSDSLWQAHDPRFDADQVMIIPGPEALRGIETADEPIAHLLGRFEQAMIAHVGDQALSHRAFLQVPAHVGLPAGIESHTSGDQTTWHVVSDVDSHSWFQPLAARFSGPIAAVFAADTVFADEPGDARLVTNPVRQVCLAEPGATLTITHTDDVISSLSWHLSTASDERVTLSMSGPSVTFTVSLPAAKGRPTAPLRRHFLITPAGSVLLSALSPDEVREFYHLNLFGAPLGACHLFEPITCPATVDAPVAKAYGRLSGVLPGSVHQEDAPAMSADLVFSLGFPALMQALSCDELAAGLLNLVHLEHAVVPAAGWPLVAGEQVEVTAQLTHIAHGSGDGTRVEATLALHRGLQLVATADEVFFLRGFNPGLITETERDITAQLVCKDPAQLAFLVEHEWLSFSELPQMGETLTLIGSERTSHTDKGVRFGADVQITGTSALGRGKLDQRFSADHTGVHPLVALRQLLGADSKRVATAPSDLAAVADRAPMELSSWAEVSSDYNPIHRSTAIARLAGLSGPIVHGMWSAARSRAFVVSELCAGDAARLLQFDTHFQAPVLPGQPLELRAVRTGVEQGRLIADITVTTPTGTALSASAVIAPLPTAYVFPGQGIQRQGMGMDGYDRSAAARAVWDAADRVTRSELGFSLLDVVRNNPKQLICQGRHDIHDKGVLHLTQYTQVAMATLAHAQVAELREAGTLVDGAVVCGHSIGEYNALSAVAEVLPLETVVRVVWQRGMTMHTCVPRDATGRSGYAMGVIRPHHAGMSHQGALELVRDVAEETGGFVEIVNFNVRGRQYATVGALPALAELERRLMASQRPGAKSPWVLVPGIDVPFHSTRLRDGVPAFRTVLERLLPPTGYLRLIGTYVPNLVAIPFSLDLAFVQAMFDATSAPEIQALLDGYETLVQEPDAFARTLVRELFAFQFASPVRWIESQDVLLSAASEGGLAIGEWVEVGLATQPTVATMAKQTIAAKGHTSTRVRNVGMDADSVMMRDTVTLESVLPTDAPAPAVDATAADVVDDARTRDVTTTPAASPVVVAAPPQPNAIAAVTDRPVSHLDGLKTLLAMQAKVHVAQVQGSETIDDLFGGVSSRRNQALVDIGAEFDAGPIDGAHEIPIAKLADTLAQRAGAWHCPGGYLGKAQDESVRRVFGRAGLARRDVSAILAQRFGLGDGLVAAALNTLCLVDRAGESARGGAFVALDVATSPADVTPVLDTLASHLSSAIGSPISPVDQVAETAGAAVDAAVVQQLEDKILGPDGLLASIIGDASERLGLAAEAPGQVTQDPDADTAALLAAEHGEAWLDWVAPRFSAQQHVALTSSWAWARRDVTLAYHHGSRGERDKALAKLARLTAFATDSAVVSRALFHAQKAEQAGVSWLAAALRDLASGRGAQVMPLSPSRPSLQLTATGGRTFSEISDTAPGAIERLITSLRPADEQAHVQLADPAADAAWLSALRDSAVKPMMFVGRTALVTGASPGSIAIEIVRHLLRGGARVVVTTSSPKRERMAWYSQFYQAEAAPGAELHVVPFNQASQQDVDALVSWLFERVTAPDGARVRELKAPFSPDIIVPFAALGDSATLDTFSARSEAAIRVMLTGVERLVGAIGARYRRQGMPGRPAHVVLPLSPNHGGFGGDGAYAETKAGLEVLCNKWDSERDAWAAATTLCAARIGWVRGTGLMDANDSVAAELEHRTGARTFANAEMGWLLAALCTDEVADFARTAPLQADLTGGFGRIADIRAVVGRIRADLADKVRHTRALNTLRTAERALLALGDDTTPAVTVTPLPSWPPAWPEAQGEVGNWPLPSAPLSETVVIVGVGELGPCGSARTRWALEVQDELAPAAVIELAWMCGLCTWKDSARGGSWYDVATDRPITESEITTRYGDAVRKASGIRWTEEVAAGFDPDALPVLATAWLDRDFSFDVMDEAEARSFVAADPAHTRVSCTAGRWQVTRTAGAEIRVPRIAKLDRKVLGMLPTGTQLARFGLPGDMIESVDRVTLMNLVATADAFLSAGMRPDELMSHVHPARVANTQGSGMGGMQSIRRLFTDQLLDRERQGDIVQESLINVVAAYAVQSYIGSYGPMVHPVAACATAAVSLAEGMDKILSGRVDFSVTGGFDDVGGEAVVGFADMAATANTEQMTAMGLAPDQMSRANDLRRRGFVEAQGGGTILLCRGDVARDLGLPVRGVLAWAGSFSDGVHTSIPAPGLGVVAAAMGGKRSPLAQALDRFGLDADDIKVIYKHDTSTAANDPNENLIHQTIARALGRSAGNPLHIVSQKTLTGHSKGGAAAFQLIGLCQSLTEGVVAGNRNLECVDPAMRKFSDLTFSDRAMRSSEPMRAGLVTSLGFGHVGAIALVLNSLTFEAMLRREEGPEGTGPSWAAWRSKAAERERQSMARRVRILRGDADLFERQTTRPISQQAEELAMLLDPEGRIEINPEPRTVD
ncbi:MAG: DUF1729 domain-containing protein [Myxococcales bacterium]|nr:DUF1729 domain-containing protein [Myxococcales bacterium]